MGRTVLVHYHIFKNAGCSVDTSLRGSFGDAWAAFEGAHAHDVQSSAQLSRFLRAHPRLRAVSSHLARPPRPWEGGLPVVSLRHPLLRARSVYEFTRRDSAQPLSDVARRYGFAAYIRWALRRERGSIVIRNYQVVHLSPASWRHGDILDAEAEVGDLEEAKALLTSWGIAGIVETYALFARIFQALYEHAFPGLKFENLRVNATSPSPGSPVEQIAQCRMLLGTHLFHDFMGMNELDMMLYEHAGRTLDRAAQEASAVHR